MVWAQRGGASDIQGDSGSAAAAAAGEDAACVRAHVVIVVLRTLLRIDEAVAVDIQLPTAADLVPDEVCGQQTHHLSAEAAPKDGASAMVKSGGRKSG